jgi:hypothetical protein
MPAAIAVVNAARKGCAGQILLPRPNCQRQMDAAVETRNVIRNVFTVDSPPQNTRGECIKFRYLEESELDQ